MPDVVPLVYGDGFASLETSKLDKRNDLRLREGVVGDVGWEAGIVASRDQEGFVFRAQSSQMGLAWLCLSHADYWV